jgi:uncharacterized protein (DUF2384 family)
MGEQAREVTAVSTSSEGRTVDPVDYDSFSVEELARLQGVRPVASLDELARDVFGSDEEVEEFIAYTYAARRRDMA